MKNMSRLLFVVMAMPSLVAMEKRKEPERGQQEQGGGKRPRGFEFSEPRMIGFQDLPVDVQRIIFGLLQTGRGSTNAVRLQTAAESLRKFMTLNKTFKTNYLDNEAINGYLIQQLAQRYTGGNLVEAALALRTAAGGRWLANQIQQMPAGVQSQSEENHAVALLHTAARTGDLGTVSFLLNYVRNIINRVGMNNNAALVIAVSNNRIAIIEKLLTIPNINANHQNNDGHTALMVAAYDGNTAIVERLLAWPGINVNLQDTDGDTALILAAQNGHTAVVERLLGVHGINVNLQTAQEFTALMFAAEKGHTAVVERLLAMPTEPPINVNLKSEQGGTALFFAAQKGHTAIVERLLATQGINVNLQSVLGNTALMLAAQKGYTAIVERLLAAPGINVNLQNTQGVTALTFAVHNGHTAVVERLLAAPTEPPINVNLQNPRGVTALMIASEKGHTAIVERLLAVPEIAVNARANNGFTALQIALASKSPNNDAIIKLLKDHGAVE